MSKTNDGGSAFPGEKDTRFGQPNDCNEGMSLRDYFAARFALELVSGGLPPYAPSESRAQAVARISYEFADAMLAERSKGGSK